MNALLDNLIAALNRLPGIGRRTAERMAFMLVEDQRGLTKILANTLLDIEDNIVCCKRCNAIIEKNINPCDGKECLHRLCSKDRSESHVICIVESPSDIIKIEETGSFKGRYHALLGKLSPINGIGIADLKIKALLERINEENITEVLIALGSDVESEATANYLWELLEPRGIKITRMAQGIPRGSAIEYSDTSTLSDAIRGRVNYK